MPVEDSGRGSSGWRRLAQGKPERNVVPRKGDIMNMARAGDQFPMPATEHHIDQHDYRKKYDGYASRYAAFESRMDSLEKERERKEIQYDLFSGFLTGLGETEELPVDFNEKLFHRLVDYATVYSDGRVVFTFRNGVEVRTEI